MRCRPGTPVFQTKEATEVPHLRCTAHALHRVRETRESNLHIPRRLSGPTTSAVCFVRRRRGMPVPGARRDRRRRVDANRNAEVTRLVAHQEAIGLKSITDGEFRRASWQTDFLQALDGIETFLGDPKLQATGRCPKPRQDEPANGYSPLWGAVASSGFRSGSGNWLGAGIGLSSSSESAFDSGRTGVGITGKGCGIVPSGSGVGLGSGESKGPGTRERASEGGDASICTGSSAWTIAEPNVSVQKAVTRSRSWKSGRLTEAKVCKPPSRARILFAAIREVEA